MRSRSAVLIARESPGCSIQARYASSWESASFMSIRHARLVVQTLVVVDKHWWGLMVIHSALPVTTATNEDGYSQVLGSRTHNIGPPALPHGLRSQVGRVKSKSGTKVGKTGNGDDGQRASRKCRQLRAKRAAACAGSWNGKKGSW